MGLEKFAEAGIGIFAVAGLVFTIKVLAETLRDWTNNKKGVNTQTPVTPRCSEALSSLIVNNTKAIQETVKAIQENTKSNQELQTVIKVFVAEQNTKMDEVLSRIR